MKYDDLPKYLKLISLAVLFLLYLSLRYGLLFKEFLYGTIFVALWIAILSLNYWRYRNISRIKKISLITLILYLTANVFFYAFEFNFVSANYSYFAAHEKTFMSFFYTIIILLVSFIVCKTIYDLRVNKFENKNRKAIKYLYVCAYELFLTAYFFMLGNYSIGTLRISQIQPPVSITVSRYQNQKQIIVNELVKMNMSQYKINSTLLNRASEITDKDKIDEIINIISNKNCSQLEGMKRTKLFKKNINSPIIEVCTEDTKNTDESKIYFYEIEILGDGNVVFSTNDKLGTNGKIQGKESHIKEYVVELTQEEKDKLINLVT